MSWRRGKGGAGARRRGGFVGDRESVVVVVCGASISGISRRQRPTVMFWKGYQQLVAVAGLMMGDVAGASGGFKYAFLVGLLPPWPAYPKFGSGSPECPDLARRRAEKLRANGGWRDAVEGGGRRDAREVPGAAVLSLASDPTTRLWHVASAVRVSQIVNKRKEFRNLRRTQSSPGASKIRRLPDPARIHPEPSFLPSEMPRAPKDRAPAKRKRRRRPRGGKGTAADAPDCFSSLPDDVLLAITSRLPTRLVVSLSVLSHRYRNLPAMLPRLDSLLLSAPPFPIPLPATPPRLLRRLDIAPTKRVRPSDFRRAIESAADHGVSELAVRLRRRVCLPKRVFAIRSLTVLSLNTCAVPRLSAVACAGLRTLKLHRVFVNQDIVTAILSAATRLDTLEMVFCTGLIGGCTVESSSVRTFLFRPALEQKAVTLSATGLRTITVYTRPKTQKVQLAPSPDVRKAYLHIAKFREKISFRMRPFLDAAARLACLTLRGFSMLLLADEYEDTAKLPVTFQELRTLSVSLDFSSESEVVLLAKLLESCPNLQQLTVSAAENKKKDACLEKDVCLEVNLKGMLANVSCITGSLAQITFLGFKSEQYQKDLLFFLLNRAANLKKIGVQFPESEEVVVRWALRNRKAPIERKSTLYNLRFLELEYGS
ncbi:hypothetical protein ACQ4PT_018983 [Festuca glaucescens]